MIPASKTASRERLEAVGFVPILFVAVRDEVRILGWHITRMPVHTGVRGMCPICGDHVFDLNPERLGAMGGIDGLTADDGGFGGGE